MSKWLFVTKEVINLVYFVSLFLFALRVEFLRIRASSCVVIAYAICVCFFFRLPLLTRPIWFSNIHAQVNLRENKTHFGKDFEMF